MRTICLFVWFFFTLLSLKRHCLLEYFVSVEEKCMLFRITLFYFQQKIINMKIFIPLITKSTQQTLITIITIHTDSIQSQPTTKIQSKRHKSRCHKYINYNLNAKLELHITRKKGLVLSIIIILSHLPVTILSPWSLSFQLLSASLTKH